MANVVDELVVTLGLDPRQFNEGQKAALEAFKKTQEEVERGGKNVEAHGKKINEFFSTLKREAIALTAIFFGGKGVSEFTQYITTLDASTARLGRTLNMSAEELSGWQGVARRTGGTVETVGGTMQGLTDKVQTFMLTGQGSFLPMFNAMGISLFDANRNLKTAGQLMLNLNHAVQGMDPARARAMLTSLGVDSATVNLLLTEEKTLRAMLEDQKLISQTTGEGADNAERLARAWSEAEQSSESFGRKLLNVLSPGLLTLLRVFTGFLKKINNPGGAGTDIAELSAGGFYIPESQTATGGPGGGVIGSVNDNLKRSAIEGYIREAAAKRGIDPETAVAVAKSEGLNGYVGDRGSSFGPFQLHYGGVASGGMAVGGLGDAFTKKTGLDARDPSTVQQQIDFALDNAAQSGWGAWHGWKGLPRAGLAGARPLGAGQAASINNSNTSGDTNTTTSTTTIGKVEVHTPATDGDGIARDIGPALQRQNFGASANYGLQ